MKIKKQCPECGGKEIFKKQSAGTGTHGFDLLPGIGGMILNQASFEIYICGSCGFYQLFADEKWLKDIRQTYESVS
jgi:predicted nucleic-acid-binding Zn-ribbon protein